MPQWSLSFHLKSVGCFRLLLDNEVDWGVVAAEGVGGHAREQGRVAALGPLDADGRENAVGLDLLADGVPEKQ